MELVPESTAAIQTALEILGRGGIVTHATETCYGLACDLNNLAAVEKLFAIKNRPGDQPVSGLFPSVDEAKKYVVWNEEAEELSKKHLPGAFTIILPLRSDAPVQLFPTTELTNKRINELTITIGVRVSSSPLATELVARFGRPLSTTSANIHGQPNPYSAEDIERQFQHASDKPDLVIDSGVLPPTPPSTVVDLTGKMPEVRRKGGVM